MNQVNKILLKSLSALFTFLTIFTVNSTCMLCIGQEKEPESLKRYKSKNLL